MCLRGQEDGAEQEITGTPLPPGHGLRVEAGGVSGAPKEQFAFGLRAPCGAAYEL